MARSIDTLGSTGPGSFPQPVGNPVTPVTTTNPGLQGPFGFSSSERTATEMFQPGGLFGNILAGIGSLNTGSGGSRSNFNLNKSVQLKDIDLQKKELLRQKSAGLRDIEQGRVQGLRAAVNNALQRGIFRSGIRERNEALVERESDEAAGDLQGRIGIALERLANQRRGAAGQKFSSGGGGGGGGLTASDIQNLFAALFGLSGGSGE